MKISILFITYKHKKFVAEAIRSAMVQDYPDLELVVCDDGSPDGTREILEKELENCPPHISIIRCHSDENRGLHANFNRGLAACTGDVIVAMSGDDVSVKHRVSTICREFAAHPECMLVCSSTLRIDDAGKTLARNNTRPQNGTFKSTRLYHEIYGGAPVCGATAAYRVPLRDLFPPMGKGPHAEDNCFWFRARLIGDIHYIAEPLVHWRVHSSNQSNWERDMDTIIARKKHLKFLKSHQCMAPQWTSDLSHALNAGMITTHIYETLKRTIDLKRETSRLIRFSIESVPWSIWLGSACRFLRVSARSGTFQKSLRKVRKRYLPLRLFRCRRQKYWNSYFDGMRP